MASPRPADGTATRGGFESVMSDRKPVSVKWKGKVQHIDWDDKTHTESWPLPCHFCGYSSADYWRKKEYVFVSWGEGDLSSAFCSQECAGRWAIGETA